MFSIPVDDIVHPKTTWTTLLANLLRKEGYGGHDFDACAYSKHDCPGKWRCTNAETVGLDLGFRNLVVEHLYTTWEDFCRQNITLAAILDLSNRRQRREMGSGSAFDAMLAYGVYALDWTLVAAKDLQLDLDELP